MWSWVLLLVGCVVTGADYVCVCNYGSQVPVQSAPNSDSNRLGHLYEYDCKEFIPMSKLDHAWLAVAYNHTAGYVSRSNAVQIDSCAGSPSTSDKITSATPLTSTTAVPTSSTTLTTRTTTSVTSTPEPTTKPATTTPTLTTTTTTTTTTATTQPSTTTANPDGNTHLCPTLRYTNGDSIAHVFGEHGGFCYGLIYEEKVSWQHAEKSCTDIGGHLVYITSAEEQQFIQGFLLRHKPSNAVWIGLQDTSIQGFVEWSSGDRVTYTNWESGSRDYFANCVVLVPYHGGKWLTRSCGNPGFLTSTDSGEKHYPLCKRAVHLGHATTTTPSHFHQVTGSYVCRRAMDGAAVQTHRGDDCYALVTDRKVSWQNANSICQRSGAHLAYIGSEVEQRFLQDFLQRNSPNKEVWIGLSDTSTEGHFRWTNGRDVTYTNWLPGHLDNFHSHHQEDCVVMVPFKNGMWDDVTCGTYQHGLTEDTGEVHQPLCQYKSTTQVFVG